MTNPFRHVKDECFRLKGQLSTGRISREQFKAAPEQAMLQDAQGRYWMLGTDSGNWYFHNGQTWPEGQPY